MPIDSEHCLLQRNALTKQSRRATCREPSDSALPAPLHYNTLIHSEAIQNFRNSCYINNCMKWSPCFGTAPTTRNQTTRFRYDACDL